MNVSSAIIKPVVNLPCKPKSLLERVQEADRKVWKKYMDARKTVNDTLVKLFNDVWDLEKRAIITPEFEDITNNDMHIIEAVGLGSGRKMTDIANRLNITVGALTTSMNSLVRKHYVVRERSEDDRRIVNIRLMEKGEAAYRHHENFHEKMTDAVMNYLDGQEQEVLCKALNGLMDFFYSYGKKRDQ